MKTTWTLYETETEARREALATLITNPTARVDHYAPNDWYEQDGHDWTNCTGYDEPELAKTEPQYYNVCVGSNEFNFGWIDGQKERVADIYQAFRCLLAVNILNRRCEIVDEDLEEVNDQDVINAIAATIDANTRRCVQYDDNDPDRLTESWDTIIEVSVYNEEARGHLWYTVGVDFVTDRLEDVTMVDLCGLVNAYNCKLPLLNSVALIIETNGWSDGGNNAIAVDARAGQTLAYATGEADGKPVTYAHVFATANLHNDEH